MSKAKWTILVYIAAHNNLQMQGNWSLEALQDASKAPGSAKQVQLAMLYDTSDGATRFVPHLNIAETLTRKDFDSGNAGKLVEIAKWAFEKCPAERYGLVLWSHGTGWMPNDLKQLGAHVGSSEAKLRAGSTASPALFRQTLETMLNKPTFEARAICFDDGSQHSLDTIELADVTQKISTFLKQPLDLLGMDACLMASLEVAYQLRNSVRYIAASEELVPGTSWPYAEIMSKLQADADMDGAALSRLIVDEFYAHYKANRPPANSGDVTQVALDLSAVDAVVKGIDTLAGALLDHAKSARQDLWTVQKQTRETETLNGQRTPSKFAYHLWDIGSVCDVLAETTKNAEVRAAALLLQTQLKPGGFILREQHLGAWFERICGVSLYMAPPNLTRITEYYPTMALAQDTRWNTWLQAYHG